MTELRVNWSKKTVKRAFAAFLAVVLCAASIQATPIKLFASNVLKAATSGNGTSTTDKNVTPGNGASTDQGTTPGNGTSVDQSTTAGNGTEKVTIASVTLSKTSYTYNGKAKTPSVTVKDSNGNIIASSNYKVSYSNNKNVGTATVKVTATGTATGSKSVTFKIIPAKTSISKIVSTSKGFKVTWKKRATQTTGYQVRYSTTSKFTSGKTQTVKLSKNTTTSKTIAGLSGGKKYYVQVRTYKTVSGKTFYSSWSDSVIVTTRK